MLKRVTLVCLISLCLCYVFSIKSIDATVTEIFSVTETESTTVTETEPITETTTEPQNTMTVVATAYFPCVKCCGKWALNRPNGIVYTASGKIAKANHTIAVDTKVIPFGTKVLINGKKYVAEDTGSAIKGNKIDIYFDSHEEALEYGKKILEIEIME